jgi:hypothetical protein
MPLLRTDTLLDVQLLLLDAGLLLSLYAGWRVAHASIRLWVPWALLVAGLYAGGVWVFLQPMQMRSMVHG